MLLLNTYLKCINQNQIQRICRQNRIVINSNGYIYSRSRVDKIYSEAGWLQADDDNRIMGCFHVMEIVSNFIWLLTHSRDTFPPFVRKVDFLFWVIR
jgi:hypothetical protein